MGWRFCRFQPFGRCIKVCPKNLVRICGTEYEAKDLARKILEYSDFFELNNGGVTFSGGEPLLQHKFVKEVCSHLDGIHKAIQTSGYADEETQMQAHTAFADDRRNLRIETTDGLRFFIAFYPSYDWIYGIGTLSYYQIDDQMHEWIVRNLN